MMTERQGVEIDYCPKCRGVWLDRGELDKLVEKALAEFEPRQPAKPAPAPQPDSLMPPAAAYPTTPPVPTSPQIPVAPVYPQMHGGYSKDYYSYKHGKQKSLLHKIFDF
jgi:Zn-finger nucleic acid-binding protein